MRDITVIVQKLAVAQPSVAMFHAHSPARLGGVAPGHHTQAESSHGNVKEVGMETQATPHAPAARPVGSMGVMGDRQGRSLM